MNNIRLNLDWDEFIVQMKKKIAKKPLYDNIKSIKSTWIVQMHHSESQKSLLEIENCIHVKWKWKAVQLHEV